MNVVVARKRGRNRQSSTRSRPIRSEGPLSLGQTAKSLALPGGPLVAQLDNSDRIAAGRLFELVTQVPQIPQALAEFNSQFMHWASNSTIDPDIAGLLTQAAIRVTAGFRACLVEPWPRNMDASRFLMEVEHLLREFAAEPERVREWRSLEPYMRNQNYGFGKLRGRREQRLGLASGGVLPDRDEYALHSTFVHPRPLNELPQETESNENRLGLLLIDLLDLFGHAQRVWEAACIAVPTFIDDPTAPSTTGRPLNPEVIRAVMDYQDQWQSRSPLPARPVSMPIKHNPEDWLKLAES